MGQGLGACDESWDYRDELPRDRGHRAAGGVSKQLDCPPLLLVGAHDSGTGIGNIDTQGNVHPDQFWQSLTLGNVKERPFSEIWRDTSNETLTALRNRNGRLEGKCAGCRFLDVCGGGFRVRAVQVHGNLWAPDPACYLSEQEIARPQMELAGR